MDPPCIGKLADPGAAGARRRPHVDWAGARGGHIRPVDKNLPVESPKKNTSVHDLCGASKKHSEKQSNGQKPPNGQKYPEKRVFDNKNGFMVV